MWAFTNADPYEIALPDPEDGLGQLPLDMDLHILFENSSVQLKERPYLNESKMELEIGSINLTLTESQTKGRYKIKPDQHLLMT